VSLAKDFAERGWIRAVSAAHGLYECECIACGKRQPVIEPPPSSSVSGGPDLKTLVEECGWSFPVRDGRKICLCPTCTAGDIIDRPN
jgi:hypothetical protein